jgi:leucyl-tRNA synthetase
VSVAPDADEAAVTSAAKASEKVAESLDGKTVRKTIYVPGRLLNLVVG